MGDLTTGYTFVSGEKNVNHSKLNAAVNDATVNDTFITGKSPASAVTKNDTLLLYSTTDVGVRKATLLAAVFDHAQLITDRSPITPVAADTLLIKDADGGYGKATMAVAIFNNAELIKNRDPGTTPAAGDEVLVKDAGADTYKRVTRTNFIGYEWPSYIKFDNAALAQHDHPVTADSVLIWDSVAEATKKTTLGLLQTHNESPNGGLADADTIVLYDTSASVIAKVMASELATYVGTKIGTYTKSAPTVAVPAAAGTASVAHGLAGVPQMVRVVLKCTDAGGDGGWAKNDEVEITALSGNTGTYYLQLFAFYVDGTNVNVRRVATHPPYIINKASGALVEITPAKWLIKAYCTYFS